MTSPPLDFLAGGGGMGALMRDKDWVTTPLGEVQHWPDALRTAVSICLSSRFPMVLWWGSELAMLYNDAWRPVLGQNKHPHALGSPGREIWPEIWDIIGEQLRGVLERGEASWSEDLLLVLERNGFAEEAYFTYSYSPIKDGVGQIGGVFSAVSETTERVLSERRLAMLKELAERAAAAKGVEDACSGVAEVLGRADADAAFAMLYLVAEDGPGLRLVASTGLSGPAAVQPGEEDPWGLFEAVAGRAVVLEDLAAGFGRLPGGRWPEPCNRALVLPVTKAAQQTATGVLVLGLSPRLAFDSGYRRFCELIADQTATALANARAYSEERARAEALAELDRAKTTFFANVSHEFRTPLTLMLGPLAETLIALETRLSAEEIEQLQMVERNGLRLLKLVNNLLDFSRVEAGRLQARYRPTDLVTFTADLASVFRSAVERAGLRLSIESAPLPEPIWVDCEMWEKIVLNLLSNAFKYTFEGEIVVALVSGEGRVCLSVRDTGIGIAPEELPRLFERFHRVEGARGRTHEGSGIGLALVAELVRLHGGTVEVASTPGVGSVFTVSIPTGTAHLDPGLLEYAGEAAPTALGAIAYVEETLRWFPGVPTASKSTGNLPRITEQSQTKPARILLADDNADMREYILRQLAERYEVEAVGDGKQALEAIARQMPDLVLTDLMMPNLDGFGLLAALRGEPSLHDIPVIALSARAGEEARIQGLAAGADDYLVKPFFAKELVARVEARLELARLRQESSRLVRKSEERARLAIGVAQLGTWHYHRDSGRIELDERMREIWGVRSEVAVLPVARATEHIHPEDRGLVAKAVEAAFDPDSSGGYEIDYRLVWPDGTVRWVSSKAQAQYDGKGASRRALGLFGTALDITERKHSEQALLERVRLATFVSEVGTALTAGGSLADILHCCTDAAVRHLDAAFARIWTLDEPRGVLVLQASSGLYTHLDGPHGIVPVGRFKVGLIAQERKPHVTNRVVGDPRVSDQEWAVREGMIAFAGYPLVLGERLVGVVAMFARHPLNEAITQTLASVANGIALGIERKRSEAQRAALLEREQKARALAEEANRIKDEFLATLGHELRSPLNAILGWVQLLRRRRMDAVAQAKALEVIDRNARIQNKLIEDLLDVSRIITGKLCLDVQPIELTAIIAAALDTVRLAAEAKTIRLTTTGLEPVTVAGDPDRLQQVVWNLLSNAVKFTPKDGWVQVELSRIRTHVEIIVTDSGAGIASEVLPHIFDRFRQADSSTTRLYGGLGLGLAIVRQLTELHGGSVRADSPGLGGGATFTVRLPVWASEHPGDEETGINLEETSQLAETNGLPHLEGVRVLVVDDEPDGREMVRAVLEICGAKVTTATSATEALALLDRSPFDVLVSDIGMPCLDGYGLIREVRRLGTSAGQVPAAALTAYARPEDRTRALLAGFQQHLSKPVEPTELIAVVAALAGRSGSHDAEH